MKTMKFTPAELVADRVLYLNLDRRDDRQRRIAAIFQELNIRALRVPAIDGQLLQKMHPKCRATESAVTRGHKVMWEVVARSQQAYALFEDDVIFCQNMRSYWHEQTIEIPSETDILLLGVSWPQVKVDQIFPHLYKPSACYGLFSYILFPTGAKKLLSTEANNPDYICDHYLDVLIRNNTINAYIPKPSWCIALCDDSDVAPRNLNASQRFGRIFADFV
jgi:GR25 family glycosyltransferase involved in LPS biosynthesis